MMMEGALSGLDITPEEAKRLQECLRNPEFKNLFTDYARSLQDSKTREKNTLEIESLEKEAFGGKQKLPLVIPNPSFALEARAEEVDKLIVVNCCSADHVVDAREQSEGGWGIPYSVGEPRNIKKDNQGCLVYDMLFSPNSIESARKDSKFLSLVVQTAVECVEEHCHFSLIRKSIKFVQQPCYGSSPIRLSSKSGHQRTRLDEAAMTEKKHSVKESTQIQTERKQTEWRGTESLTTSIASLNKAAAAINLNDEFTSTDSAGSETESSSKKLIQELNTTTVTPNYRVVHQGEFEWSEHFEDTRIGMRSRRPKSLVVRVDLPLLESADQLVLEVEEQNRLLLEVAGIYYLNLPLPYYVDEEQVSARFDRDSKELEVSLHLSPPSEATPDFAEAKVEEDGVGVERDSELQSDKKERSYSDASFQPPEEKKNEIGNASCDDRQLFGREQDEIAHAMPFPSLECFSPEGSLRCSVHQTADTLVLCFHVSGVESSSVSILVHSHTVEVVFCCINGKCRTKVDFHEEQSLVCGTFGDFFEHPSDGPLLTGSPVEVSPSNLVLRLKKLEECLWCHAPDIVDSTISPQDPPNGAEGCHPPSSERTDRKHHFCFENPFIYELE